MRKIKQKDLSIYLGVTPQAISDYKKTPLSKKKLDLMLNGLRFFELEKLYRVKTRVQEDIIKELKQKLEELEKSI